ncbi:MAG: flagellin lysine-N-methylase [Ruminococcus sp.]|nr:flagellin lysine-N-methylase [Ruminococcus sp.]
MTQVFPDYYNHFRCIADKCKHNCCIGWEIDIDEDTARLYSSIEGDIGTALRENISTQGDCTHFVLREGDRCPFLTDRNLCRIINELGEDHLCHICAQHPRFHNQLPDRIESGLGMCCEEAARLILTHSSPTTLITEDEPCGEDEIIALRDRVILILQDRSLDIKERVTNALNLCGTNLTSRTTSQWIDLFISLERLDEKWTEILELVRRKHTCADTNGFDIYIKERQTEYEQLLVYLIYRHMANAPTLEDACPRVALAALCYEIIYTAAAVLWTENGSFDTEQQIELCRMLSSEIEYSDENLYILLDNLY